MGNGKHCDKAKSLHMYVQLYVYISKVRGKATRIKEDSDNVYLNYNLLFKFYVIFKALWKPTGLPTILTQSALLQGVQEKNDFFQFHINPAPALGAATPPSKRSVIYSHSF